MPLLDRELVDAAQLGDVDALAAAASTGDGPVRLIQGTTDDASSDDDASSTDESDANKKASTVDSPAGTIATIAAASGHVHLLEWIAQQPELGIALLRAFDGDGDTIATAAAMHGRSAVLEWIGDHPHLGTDFLRKPSAKGSSIASCASVNGDVAMFEWIAAQPELGPAFIAAIVPDGGSVATHAAWFGNVDVLKWIRGEPALGLDLLIKVDESGDTVATAALKNSQVNVLEWIRDQPELHADFVQALTKSGRVAATKAALNGHVDMLKLVAQLPALAPVIFPLTSKQGLVFDTAVRNGHVNVLEWFMAHPLGSAAFNALSQSEQHDVLPLQAAVNGHVNVLEWIATSTAPELGIEMLQTVEQQRVGTLFVAAITTRHLNVLDWLVAHPALGIGSPRWAKTQDIVVGVAINAGDVDLLERIAGHPKHNRTSRTELGVSIAMMAAATGNVDVLKWIVAEPTLGPELLKQPEAKSGHDVLSVLMRFKHSFALLWLRDEQPEAYAALCRRDINRDAVRTVNSLLAEAQRGAATGASVRRERARHNEPTVARPADPQRAIEEALAAIEAASSSSDGDDGGGGGKRKPQPRAGKPAPKPIRTGKQSATAKQAATAKQQAATKAAATPASSHPTASTAVQASAPPRPAKLRPGHAHTQRYGAAVVLDAVRAERRRAAAKAAPAAAASAAGTGAAGDLRVTPATEQQPQAPPLVWAGLPRAQLGAVLSLSRPAGSKTSERTSASQLSPLTRSPMKPAMA